MGPSEPRPTGLAVFSWLVLTVVLGALLRSGAPGTHPLHVHFLLAVPLVAFAALSWPPGWAVAYAALAGFDLDVAAAAPGGLFAASFGLAALLAALARRRWLDRTARDGALACALVDATVRISSLMLLALAERPIGWSSVAEALVVPSLVLHAALGALMWRPLEALARRVARTPSHGLPRGLFGGFDG